MSNPTVAISPIQNHGPAQRGCGVVEQELGQRDGDGGQRNERGERLTVDVGLPAD